MSRSFPRLTLLLGGALRFTEYDYFQEQVVKFIALKRGDAAGTEQDWEFTDWKPERFCKTNRFDDVSGLRVSEVLGAMGGDSGEEAGSSHAGSHALWERLNY